MKYLKLASLIAFFFLTSSNYSQKIKVKEIMNLDLNSEYAEIGIRYLKNNKVLFASSKKNKSGKKRDKRNNRNMALRLYTGSMLVNGEISDVKLFSEAENNPINESNITFTSDYKTVYFTRNNYIQDDYREQFKKDTLDNQILKLFKATVNSEGVLSNITPLPINNASYSVTNPQLSSNNKKLYFTSDMKSSYGSFDIYEMDIHADGTYGTPKNLGANINSKGTEMFPFVTDNHILYYASNGFGGLGELDVFSVSLDEENVKPTNLGSPINSKKDDFSFIYNPNNLTGFFASNRKGGNGGADLYAFIVEPDLIEPEEEIAATEESPTNSEVTAQHSETKIEDSIVSKAETTTVDPLIATTNKTDQPIANDKYTSKTEQDQIDATIASQNLNQDKELTTNSKKSNSNFIITSTIVSTDDDVNKNVENELLLLEPSTPNDASKATEKDTEQKIDTVLSIAASEKSNTLENEDDATSLVALKDELKTSEVTNEKLNQTVTIDSLNKATASVAVIPVQKTKKCTQIIEGFITNPKNTTLNNATVTVYENGKNVGTYKVSPEGKYSLELKCNYHYRITARLNKFEESYFELRTNHSSGSVTTTNIVMERIPCDILITGQFLDSKTKAPLSNVKLYLIQNNELVGSTATKHDGTYTFKANCDEEYQINTDKFGYEESLFDINKSEVNNSTIAFNASLKPLKCAQVLNGRITDLDSGTPLINIKVDLLDKNGDLKETAQSNTNGNYHFTIDCDEAYTVSAEDKFYESASSEFKATSENKQVNRLDIPLKSLACIQTLDGIVLNSRTKVPMANVTVNLLKNGQIIETKTSPSSGIFNFEVDCESNYSITASSKDFYDNSKELVTSKERNSTVDFSIKLESKLDFDLVRGEMMIITKPIDFDLNKSEIREDAAIELTKIINAMTKNPSISVTIGVHTDSRGPDTYNMILSEERAQSIMSYLISRGIDASRLTGKGYGETQLLNKCSNGVKCTEEEHLVNRRIEFIVSQ